MPDSTSNKTWRDVVAAAPTGTITEFRNNTTIRGGSIDGIRVDEQSGCMLVDYVERTTPPRSTWLKVEANTGAIRVPLSVAFLEEGVGTEDHRFIVYTDEAVITIYMRKYLVFW